MPRSQEFALLSCAALFGLLVGAILFYLTPLNHFKLVAPRAERVDAAQFWENYTKNPDAYFFLDIRAPEYRALEYPPGSVSMPLNTLVGELDNIPRDKKIVIFCESNFSSSAAYHVLQDNGFTDLQIVNGGRTMWKQLKLPLEKGDEEGIELASEIIRLRGELKLPK